MSEDFKQLRRDYDRMTSSLTVTRPVSNNAPVVSDRYRKECTDCYAMIAGVALPVAIASAYDSSNNDCE